MISEEALHKLGEINGKLDMVIANQREDREDDRDRELRLRGIEKKQYILSGASGVVGATVALLFGHSPFRWPF